MGKRIRCRLDGSKFFKIHLDMKDKDFMEGRLENISALYKKFTTSEVVFEFKKE